MNRLVLCIDGPERGNIVTAENNTFERMYAVSHSVVTYHVHRFRLCGRMLSLASLSLSSDDIMPADVFEFIASDSAKKVAAP